MASTPGLGQAGDDANARLLAEATRPYGRITAPSIAESSGLVASRNHSGVLWTHGDHADRGDRGDRGRIFGIDEHGELLVEIEVIGAQQQDWEDIAIDDQGRIYLGDIGNNANQRTDLVVYVMPEPDPARDHQVTVSRRIAFRFPELPYPPPASDRNYDAESLFWARGRLYLLTKHRSDSRTRLYRFPDLETTDQTVLEPVASFDLGGGGRLFGGMATAADVTADGRYLAVLSYHALLVFEVPDDGDDYLANPVLKIDFPGWRFGQCEAIAWVGRDLIFGNEQGELFRMTEPLANVGRP